VILRGSSSAQVLPSRQAQPCPFDLIPCSMHARPAPFATSPRPRGSHRRPPCVPFPAHICIAILYRAPCREGDPRTRISGTRRNPSRPFPQRATHYHPVLLVHHYGRAILALNTANEWVSTTPIDNPRAAHVNSKCALSFANDQYCESRCDRVPHPPCNRHVASK
jgi:hypothetical protein